MLFIELLAGVLYFENFDVDSIVTPVNADRLNALLKATNYSESETQFLISGFTHGFPIRYQGNPCAKLTAPNLKLNSPNEEVILWNKVMEEV